MRSRGRAARCFVPGCSRPRDRDNPICLSCWELLDDVPPEVSAAVGRWRDSKWRTRASMPKVLWLFVHETLMRARREVSIAQAWVRCRRRHAD